MPDRGDGPRPETWPVIGLSASLGRGHDIAGQYTPRRPLRPLMPAVWFAPGPTSGTSGFGAGPAVRLQVGQGDRHLRMPIEPCLPPPGEHKGNMAFDERIRLHLRLAIRMALGRLPWVLLTGAEKGRRDRLEEDRRLEVATEACVADLEKGTLEIRHGKGPDGHSTW